MSEKPVRIETYMENGRDQIMFTLVYADGYRTSYWKPFFSGCWHAFKLILRGFDVVDTSGDRP